MAFDVDLFVIGGGSGGVRAARIAAEHGARVALAEEYRMGGTCVIRGCVPKKLLVYASSFADAFEDARGYGWTAGEPRFDWRALVAAKDAEIARLEAAYRDRLVRAGVRVIAERAVLADAHRVRLRGGSEVTASHILVATGGAPEVPDIPGAGLGVTSNEMFDLEALPERLVIVGGGYVACEFAGIMNGLGVHVTQLYRGEQVLRGFDRDLRDHVADAMRARGVALEVGRQVARIERAGEGLTVVSTGGETWRADRVLFATGRRPATRGLGLEAPGVRLSAKGAVVVDDWSQSSVPSIFAVGDVTDRVALTPVAIHEGHAFADTVFGGRPRRSDHRLIGKAVFTQPEAATVGLTEEEARAAGEVQVYRARFLPMVNTLARRDERMLMKMVVDVGTRRVLGVHIAGHGAAEMIQLAAVAVRMGATREDFDETMPIHPTSAEELVTLRAASA